MSLNSRLGAVAIVLSVTAVSAAATPYAAGITQPDAEVRCLPGTKDGVYATNRLRQGQRVDVLKEREDGWLEVKPPEGSFSWINTRFVEQVVPNQPNYVVIAYPSAGAPVLIGSDVLKHRPSVVGVKLQRGTQVRAIGRPLADDEGTWLPIEPPVAEVRFLRQEAIGKSAPPAAAAPPPAAPPAAPSVTAARVATSPGPGPLGSFQNPMQGGSALAPLTDVDGMWQRAAQAERGGNYAEAIRLYTQVGNESANNNRQLAIEAYNRAHYLSQATRTPVGSAFYPTGQQPTPPAAPASAGYPTTAVPAQPSAQSPAAAPPVRLAAPVTGTSFSGQTGQGDPALSGSSGPGRLRVAGRSIGSQRLYVLENARGIPVVYAAPQGNLNLEPYVGRNVELYGPTYYQGSLRANYMSVMRVVPLQ